MKLHIYIIIATVLLLLLPSCEMSDNGDLDGYWYMTRIDSIQSGKTVNKREDRLTWEFQDKILEFYNHNDLYEFRHTLMARFEHSDGQLIVYNPFRYDRMNGDVALTADSLEYLRPYSINAVPDTFQVEKLSDSKLQITDNYLRIYFEKY